MLTKEQLHYKTFSKNYNLCLKKKNPSSFCCDFFQFARKFVPISFPELCYPCPATLCFAICLFHWTRVTQTLGTRLFCSRKGAMTIFVFFTFILYRVNKRGKNNLYLARLNVDHAVPMLVCQCHTHSTSIHCLHEF